jgi:cAMP-dependent protein kinase regulator
MFHRHGVPRSRLEVLRGVPLFEGLPDRVLSRLDSHIDDVQVPAGKHLTDQGTRAYEAFIIVEGEAEVVIDGKVVGTTEVGEMIGEIGVLKNTLRMATVTAKTPMRLFVVTPREIGWLFEDKELARRVEANLERHLSGNKDR